MSASALAATVAYFALLAYFLLLWARFVLDLVSALNAAWRPRGAVLLLAEVTFTVTDPPIRAVRRILPPMRIGGFALDFGFTIVMVAVVVLMFVASSVGTARVAGA